MLMTLAPASTAAWIPWASVNISLVPVESVTRTLRRSDAGATPVAPAATAPAPNPEVAAIHAVDDKLVKAFNAGKADEVAAFFHPQAEFTDEEGVVYQGRPAIQDLMTKYFAKFPGAKLTIEIQATYHELPGWRWGAARC